MAIASGWSTVGAVDSGLEPSAPVLGLIRYWETLLLADSNDVGVPTVWRDHDVVRGPAGRDRLRGLGRQFAGARVDRVLPDRAAVGAGRDVGTPVVGRDREPICAISGSYARDRLAAERAGTGVDPVLQEKRRLCGSAVCGCRTSGRVGRTLPERVPTCSAGRDVGVAAVGGDRNRGGLGYRGHGQGRLRR